MVLTNTLKLELALITLLCISASTLELPNRSQAPETTTTSAKATTEVQTATATTQKLSAISSKPKTDNSNNNQNAEQKQTRGSTKYADYAYSTTEATKEAITSQHKSQQTKNAKLTTMRNDRSLSLNTDKYNSPEFHSENNIYPESQVADRKYGNINKDKYTTEKSWGFGHFAELELTTPKNDFFDSKYQRMQDDISRSFNDMLTTDTGKVFEDKYKEMHEESIVVELTTPKDEQFDSRHEEIREDLAKTLEHIDNTFDGKTKKTIDTIEKPAVNDTELVSLRYRNIEANKAINKNNLHKDYIDETGLQMQLTSKYNNSQTIDAPGIVANTIPTRKDSESVKKMDLDQGETTLERISIEKPEKDPSTLFNNKIEAELTREAPEEKPYEHKSIYLSKRGSTIQSKEQPIENILSTEAGIPLDFYPSRSSSLDLKHSENGTFVPKTIKKDKVINKTMKKELEEAPLDLDNKIPKFLPLTTINNAKTVITTTNSIISESSKPSTTVELTTETFYEVDNPSTTSEVLTSMESTMESTTENFSTSETENFYDISESGTTFEPFQETDSTSTKATTGDDVVYTESTTDHLKLLERVTVQPIEDITTQNDDKIELSTMMAITEFHTNKTTDMENIAFSYNNSRNEIGYITEHVTLNNTTDESIQIITLINNTTEKIPISTSLPEVINTATAANVKKNESVPSIINEVTKSSNSTINAAINNDFPNTKSTNWDSITENILHGEEIHNKENSTKQQSENDQTKQNEIVCDRLVPEECENSDDGADYSDTNFKPNNAEEGNESDTYLEENDHNQHSHNEENKLTTSSTPLPIESVQPTTQAPVSTTYKPIPTTTTTSSTTPDLFGTQIIRQIDATDSDVNAKTDSIVSSEEDTEEDGGNGGKIAAIVISTIGGICLLLLVALLIIMKKRQKRFNYGQRCRPVSLDAYSMDNVSIHNSTRRKGVLMTSKRSYGNPAFEDPTLPTHLLNISELLKFSNNDDGVKTEFEKIPQVTTKTNELPEGCDVKNRYANVIPLPETRVFLSPIEGVLGSDYINANYVTGPQGARHYYIACQAPMQNTIEDFWRMIWEQQSKVVLMITHLYESGVEKCIDYLPPSEVLDCHRLFGDYQVTLKKREVKDKYIISSLQLKNMVSNSWREVTHLWYMGWPEKGVPDEANSLIAFLIEARSCMKTGDNKVKETNNTNISNGLTAYMNPVIVHCSPGTGRTGTVIACDIAIREFELTRKVDIPKIVYRIRRDRASAVQTKEQYAYIYKVIQFYATKLTGGAFDSF